MNKKQLKWVIATGMMTAFVPSAMAGTVSNSNKLSVTLGGYVDRAFLYMDDGDNSRTAVVDNENLSSRFFIAGSAPINERVTAGFLMEVQYRDNSSSDVSIDDASAGGGSIGDHGAGATTFTQRHMDIYFSDAKLGKFSIGQGDLRGFFEPGNLRDYPWNKGANDGEANRGRADCREAAAN